MNLSRALLVVLLLGLAAPIGLVGFALPVYAQEEDDWDSDDAETDGSEAVDTEDATPEAANTENTNPEAGNLETGGGDDQEQIQQPAASAAEEAKDPFALPAEVLNGFQVDALPDPSRSVEQIKEEAEARVQKFLEEERRSEPASDAPPGGN